MKIAKMWLAFSGQLSAFSSKLRADFAMEQSDK